MSVPPAAAAAAASNPAIAAQLNVRQNAAEISAFLKDLQSWSGDVKKKDEALSKGELVLTKQTAKPPPIRGSAAADGGADGPAKVLLPSSASADEARFAAAKAAGNAAFAAGRYEESLTHYAQCMLLAPRDAVIPSNRSQALLKLSRWHEAEVDASTALTLDPGAVKALFRRAQARRQLRKYAAAAADCAELAKLDPQNKPAKALAAEVAALLQKQQEAKAKASVPVVSSAPVAGATAASAKPATSGAVASPAAAASSGSAAPAAAPAAASVPGARRMVIQEDEDDEDDEEEVVPVNRTTTAAPVATAPVAAAAASPAKAPASVAPAAAASTTTAASPQKAASAATTAPTASAASVTAAAPATAAASSPARPAAAASIAASPASPSAASSSASSSSAGLVAPLTAYDFDSTFRAIRSSPARVAAYLRLLPSPPAARYPALMKTALEGGLLRAVGQALLQELLPQGEASLALQVLEGVAHVPRFNVARMMLDAQDKTAFASIFRTLQEQHQQAGATPQGVAELAAKYSVKL